MSLTQACGRGLPHVQRKPLSRPPAPRHRLAGQDRGPGREGGRLGDVSALTLQKNISKMKKKKIKNGKKKKKKKKK